MRGNKLKIHVVWSIDLDYIKIYIIPNPSFNIQLINLGMYT